MIDSPCLAGRSRYERIMEGRVDDAGPGTLAHTVQLTDDDRGVEVTVVATPSPSYEIRQARGRLVRGDVDAAVLAGLIALAGVPMVTGLSRRVREATGNGTGAALVLDAVVEVARLARQVAKLPRERAERAGGGAWECWQLDRAAWADLPDSCFTYSEAGRGLFQGRTVATASYADLYSPHPGQRRIFERRKAVRLERSADCLRLFHSMHDNVHGFELSYEVDLASGRIVRAESVTPRLPYLGICSEPQARIRSLVGETLDAGLAKRIQTLLGGATGCAQLYDLTADLLKLALPDTLGGR